MKNLSYTVCVIALVSSLPCRGEAPKAGDFAINITATEMENRYLFSFRIQYVGKQGKILYVHNPLEFGETILLTKYKNKVEKSSSTTTYSPVSFTGIIFDGGTEHKFKMECTATGDGAIYCRELDQKLRLFETSPEVAVQCYLRVSDFYAKECSIIEVKSNYIKINFNHKLSTFPPPSVKPFDYSKLPPP